MKTKIFWLIVVLALLIVTSSLSQVKTVPNTLKEINACEGKIELILVREWGGQETENEAQYFNIPYDIEIDTEGLIYIIDSGNSRIQVFDSSGKIIAAKRLNHSCNKIRIHGDRLFVIDPYLEMAIYEYKIRF